MKAVEIEEAISARAGEPFDAQELPFAFLQPFGQSTAAPARGRRA